MMYYIYGPDHLILEYSSVQEKNFPMDLEFKKKVDDNVNYRWVGVSRWSGSVAGIGNLGCIVYDKI